MRMGTKRTVLFEEDDFQEDIDVMLLKKNKT